MTAARRWLGARWRQSLVVSLTLFGVLATAVLALVVSRVVGQQIRSDALTRAGDTAELLARSSFAPRLPAPEQPLSARARHELDAQVAAARSSRAGLEIALLGANGKLLYSSSPAAARSLAVVRPAGTGVVHAPDGSRRVRTVLPVRKLHGGAPAALLEQETPYAPVARDISSRTWRLDLLLIVTALAIYLLALPSLLRAARAVRVQYDPRRQELARDLRRAIARDELSLAFQPIVDARTGRLRSLEALVRWTDPRRGEISPAMFIPSIEQTNAIWGLTLHVFELSFRQASWWRAGGLRAPIAVNLSGAVLHDRRLVPALRRLADEHKLDPDTLEVEITEGALVHNPPEATRVLREIAEIGLRVIAIDDFGTGYSSLSRLHELPLDTLKIDQSFVKRMATVGDGAIVESVIQLAHALGLDVIAEGVEDDATAKRLCGLGCEYLQGYLFSRPLAAADAAAWLERVPGVPFEPGHDPAPV